MPSDVGRLWKLDHVVVRKFNQDMRITQSVTPVPNMPGCAAIHYLVYHPLDFKVK